MTLPSVCICPNASVNPLALLISLTFPKLGIVANACKLCASAPPEPTEVTRGGPLNLTLDPAAL
jgi:hypothetical protein